jgi:hypothetical protein
MKDELHQVKKLRIKQINMILLLLALPQKVTNSDAMIKILVIDYCLHFEEKNSNRIRTDIEFGVFQGALSHANAQHSCKLMRQASCDKIRRKPFA